jgi:TIR domain
LRPARAPSRHVRLDQEDRVGESPTVFLGHAYPDREIVQRIADSLAALGIRTIVDEATLFLGDSLLERVSATIGPRGYVAVALSPRSVRAAWVQVELKSLIAREQSNGVVILPLLVADCELPDFLEDRFFADFRRSEAFQQSLDLIVRRLGLPDTFRGLKEVGAAWEGPLRFEFTTNLKLFLVFFDGSEVVVGSAPRAPTAIYVPDDTRVAKLPLFAMAQTLPLDLGDGEYRIVHSESGSPLRPQRTLRSQGVASGDHLVVAVGQGATMDPDVILRHSRSVLQNHDR